MKLAGNTCAVRREQGFDVFVLRNQDVELAAIPELGARIVSLKDLRTGREWLWHPVGERKLFRNRLGDKFESGPLAGWDECLPTIAPCVWQQRHLPDHGEIWAAACELDLDAWGRGLLCTSVSLRISPFDFERTIELQDNQVRLNYRLNNRSSKEESYLWAMHPLLQLQAGDTLELPASTRALLNRTDWIETLGFKQPKGVCEKIFASGITEGRAAIQNPESGDRLQFTWNARENNTLGLWLTSGGWHGHEHFAIEPANGEPDVLLAAAQKGSCGVIPGSTSVTWQVCIQVGN